MVCRTSHCILCSGGGACVFVLIVDLVLVLNEAKRRIVAERSEFFVVLDDSGVGDQVETDRGS